MGGNPFALITHPERDSKEDPIANDLRTIDTDDSPIDRCRAESSADMAIPEFFFDMDRVSRVGALEIAYQAIP